MWRQRLLHLTFIVSLLTIVMMQKLAPATQQLEFSEAASQLRSNFIRLSGSYAAQLSASFTPMTRAWAQLWQRTEIFAEWPIENSTTEWEKTYASTAVEKELIEARFHVENAEVYEWSIENRQKTLTELDLAERFLKDVRPLVKKPALDTIERLTTELDTMKIDTTGAGASRPLDYENIKTDLDRVIHWVHITGL